MAFKIREDLEIGLARLNPNGRRFLLVAVLLLSVFAIPGRPKEPVGTGLGTSPLFANPPSAPAATPPSTSRNLLVAAFTKSKPTTAKATQPAPAPSAPAVAPMPAVTTVAPAGGSGLTRMWNALKSESPSKSSVPQLRRRPLLVGDSLKETPRYMATVAVADETQTLTVSKPVAEPVAASILNSANRLAATPETIPEVQEGASSPVIARPRTTSPAAESVASRPPAIAELASLKDEFDSVETTTVEEVEIDVPVRPASTYFTRAVILAEESAPVEATSEVTNAAADQEWLDVRWPVMSLISTVDRQSNLQPASATGLTIPVAVPRERNETVPSPEPLPQPPPEPQPPAPVEPAREPTANDDVGPSLFLPPELASQPLQNAGARMTEMRPLPTLPVQAEAPVPPPARLQNQPGAQVPEIAGDDMVLLQAARNAVALRDLNLAIQRYEILLQRRPKYLPARIEYAGVLAQAGRTAEAAAQFQRLIAEMPDDESLRRSLAGIYIQSRDYTFAEEQLLFLLQKNPKDYETAVMLARVRAFRKDFAGAAEIYNQYLRELTPTDPKTPRDLGLLLYDMRRPRESIPFLEAVRTKNPGSTEIIAYLIRAYAALRDSARTAQMLAELAARSPDDVRLRNDLGGELLLIQEYQSALLAFAQALAADPNSSSALIGSAKAYVELYDPGRAMQMLDNPAASAGDKIAYLKVLADYHHMMGEYSDAKSIYREILVCNPNDNAARLAFGALYITTGEYERAKGEYCKIPADAPEGFDARVGVASALYYLRHFSEAAALCQQLTAQYPDRAGPVVWLARSLVKMKQYAEAEAECRKFLKKNCNGDQGEIDVRLALARVLLESNKLQEAAHEYSRVLKMPGGKQAATFYGLYMASMKLGMGGHAGDSLAQFLAGSHEEVRLRIMLADLFLETGQFSEVIQLCQGVLGICPGHVPAQTRIGEAHSALHTDEDEKAGVATLLQAIQLSETNVRARRALARLYSQMHLYDDANREYDLLVAIDSMNYQIRRERARTLFNEGGYNRAAFAYRQIVEPSADQLFKADLEALGESNVGVIPEIDLLLRANISGNTLQHQVETVADAQEKSKALALQRLLVDYETNVKEQTHAQLENDEKSLLFWRQEKAIPILDGLIASEPTNEEAYFDQGQNFRNLKRTQASNEAYGRLLQVDPLHREAGIALDRGSRELNPRITGDFTWFNQRGRNGLAQIQRFFFNPGFQYVCGDENEFFGAGYTAALYQPSDDRALSGNIYTVQGQKKPNENLLLYGVLNLEEYPTRLRTRPTFNMGGLLRHSDCYTFGSEIFLNNVIENGETLRQDIFRGGVATSVTAKPARNCDVGGTYRLAFYSDSNTFHEIYTFAGIDITRPPKLLKVNFNMDWFSYRAGTVFGPGPDIVRNAVHPYFSPSSYGFATCSFEWYQWLTRDFFQGAPVTWYSVQFAPRIDTESVYFTNAKAIFHHDIRSWVSFEMEFACTESKPYNVESFTSYLIFRTP